jgi:hypothetical protein
MAGYWLVAEGGERLAAAAHWQQDLTRAVWRNRNRHPPDFAEQAFSPARRALRVE